MIEAPAMERGSIALLPSERVAAAATGAGSRLEREHLALDRWADPRCRACDRRRSREGRLGELERRMLLITVTLTDTLRKNMPSLSGLPYARGCD
jgi:hypothetical protein